MRRLSVKSVDIEFDEQQVTAALDIQIMASRCRKLIRLYAFHSSALTLHSRAEAFIPESRPSFLCRLGGLYSHAVVSTLDPPFRADPHSRSRTSV